MAERLRLLGRGYLIVILTACNVYQVAHAHYGGAFVVGMAISVTWFVNARNASRSDLSDAPIWYGLGAGLGTISGMALMRAIYG